MLTDSGRNTHSWNRVCANPDCKVTVVWWAVVRRVGQDEWEVTCPVCGRRVTIND